VGRGQWGVWGMIWLGVATKHSQPSLAMLMYTHIHTQPNPTDKGQNLTIHPCKPVGIRNRKSIRIKIKVRVRVRVIL
jgi:hypothetical protein